MMQSTLRGSFERRLQVSRWALPLLMACSAHCGSDSERSAGTPSGVNASAASGSAGSAAAAGELGSPVAGGGAGGAGATAGAASPGGTAPGAAAFGDAGVQAGSPRVAFDWNGIVGTGQSLAVGEPGAARNTPAGTARLTAPSFNNLQLSTGNLAWPVDPNDAALQMVPLVEPMGRPAPAYPSSWPTNIAFNGETPHAAMANQLTALVRAETGGDFVSVHSEAGENGQCLSFLIKGAAPSGVNGHAYEAMLIEARAITRLAQAAGKRYGVDAITVTHGECDGSNAQYAEQLYQLWRDYGADLAAITGQAQPPLLIVSQQNSVTERAASTLAQWQIGVRHPDEVVCSGPKYQYPYTADSVHLIVDGYELLGEKYAQVYHERRVLGRDWQPLQPTGVTREGRVIRVAFHVPVPPLVWEETFQLPHQMTLSEWSAGQGFEVRDGSGAPIPISSVEIAGDSVRITCGADLPAGATVGYAMSGDPAELMTTPFPGTVHWGRLRDSDPFVGATTRKNQPNFAVAFELPVP